MAQSGEQVLQPAGLYTDPSPFAALPQGALRVADNVVLRRQGLLEPRPSFDRLSITTPPSDGLPVRAYGFQTDMLIISQRGYGSGTSSYLMHWALYETQMFFPADTIGFSLNWQRAAIARGHLYLATFGRVVRVRNAGETNPVALSTPPLELTVVATAGALLDPYDTIIIRAAVKRILPESGEAERFVSTTLPTQAWTFECDSTASNVIVTVRNLDLVGKVGDQLEIYRSAIMPGNTATFQNQFPSDELFLCHAHELTAADITAKQYTEVLVLTDDELGAALYTSPSQEGMQQANVAPPSCMDVALFRGSLFFAHTKQPHRLRISFLTGDSYTVDRSGLATGIGTRTYAGTLTSGSATITSMVSTVGLEVGMRVAHANLPAGTTITATTASTVTVSANATASASASPVTFSDVLVVKSGPTAETFENTGLNNALINVINTSTSSTLVWSRAGHVRRYSSGPPQQPSVGLMDILLEAREVTQAGFHVLATHGSEYTPQLPEPTSPGALGIASTQEETPNAVWWSKTDQPEHVPTVNFMLIGDRSRILRMVPVQDALLIFKRDGLYRISGFGALAGFTVDQLDPTAVLLHPEAACTVGGDCYAWCSRGVLRVAQQGIVDISGPAIGTELRDHEDALSEGSSLDVRPVFSWACGNEKESELLLHVQSYNSLSAQYALFCYCARTGAWTRWTLRAAHGLAVSGELRLLSETDYSWLWEQRAVFNYYRGGFDRLHNVDTVSTVGNVVTIAAGSTWTPAVGDVLIPNGDDTEFGVVTAVNGLAVTLDSAAGFPSATAEALSAFTSTVEFQARSLGAPTLPKHWSEFSWQFESQQQLQRYTTSTRSSLSDTLTESTREIERGDSARVRAARHLVSRQHARAHVLYPRLVVRQALAQWRLAGVSLLGSGSASRGTTRESS